MKSLGFIRRFSTVNSATLPVRDFKLFKLQSGPPSSTECTREDALHYIKTMQIIRRLETACGNLYKEKAIRGFCHLSSGQEAIAVGVEAALLEGDAIITAYRCHGFAYTRGSSAHDIIAELCGKRTGSSLGKGGSMHLYGKNFYGGNGIVGAQVPLGAGIALALKHKTQCKNLCVALYGDGAANQGQVFEAYNMAKLWGLPCIFVCENNRYAMGTPVERASANMEYYTRGDYIPGIWVDGMDVLTVREAFRYAGDWCRSGKGPILIELETYRYGGHSMSDPGTSYRTREEVQSVRKEKDPITTFVQLSVANNLVTESEIKNLEKQAKKDIDTAVSAAKQDPEPDSSSLYAHVYASNPENFKIRGCDSYSFVS